MTPLRYVYGRAPPVMQCSEQGSTTVVQVEGSLMECEEIMQILKDNLVVAQNPM